MTSKQRAYLRGLANTMSPIFQIGKNGVEETFLRQLEEALEARELIKIRVLETCEMLPAEFAQAVAEEAGCDVVQVIGSRVVLFKKRSKDDKKPSLLDEEKQEKSKTEPKKSKNIKYGDKGGGSKSKTGCYNGRQGFGSAQGNRKKFCAAKKQGKR